MCKESILDKVSKLLAKTTENGCTPEEAQAATAMAQSLLAKYDLELSDLEDEPTVSSLDVSVGTKSVNSRQALLAIMLAKHYGCLVLKSTRKDKQYITFIGERKRPEVLKETYLFVYKAYQQCWQQYHRTLSCNKESYRNDYFEGFINGVDQVLTQNENQNAIVLRASKAVVDYLFNTPTVTRSVGVSTTGNNEAHYRGYCDGKESQQSKHTRITV